MKLGLERGESAFNILLASPKQAEVDLRELFPAYKHNLLLYYLRNCPEIVSYALLKAKHCLKPSQVFHSIAQEMCLS